MAGFTGFTGLAGAATLSLTGRLISFLAVMLRLAGPILLVLDAIKLIEFAWASAGEKLEQYSNISKDALSVGVTPEYMVSIRRRPRAGHFRLRRLDQRSGWQSANSMAAVRRAFGRDARR
ncbi:hypothetical protein QCM80_46760, partial [Bradyrhizobium sp. SSUT112]|uniref:hypothetical protein n=1 Tax=Bradyrhizobium sp. SSUT112 TaxID=3040604 RepID=UPI002446F28B